MYHMSARPQRVVTHQQSDAQLHVQLNGLWTFSRSVRPIEADASGRLLAEPARRRGARSPRA
jgi:hypothetical protein